MGLEAKGNEVLIEKDRAAAMEGMRAGPELLTAVPQFFLDETAPRPDQVDVDFDRLFAVRRVDDYAPGLYVGVRSGNINLRAGGGSVDVGAYESARLADGSDKPELIEPLPGFLFADRFPSPDEDFRPLRQIELYGPGIGSDRGECIVE